MLQYVRLTLPGSLGLEKKLIAFILEYLLVLGPENEELTQQEDWTHWHHERWPHEEIVETAGSDAKSLRNLSDRKCVL